MEGYPSAFSTPGNGVGGQRSGHSWLHSKFQNCYYISLIVWPVCLCVCVHMCVHTCHRHAPELPSFHHVIESPGFLTSTIYLLDCPSDWSPKFFVLFFSEQKVLTLCFLVQSPTLLIPLRWHGLVGNRTCVTPVCLSTCLERSTAGVRGQTGVLRQGSMCPQALGDDLSWPRGLLGVLSRGG